MSFLSYKTDPKELFIHAVPMVEAAADKSAHALEESKAIVINPEYELKELFEELPPDEFAIDNYYARTDGLNPPYYKQLEGVSEHVACRITVANMLRDVNKILEPYRIELMILSALRTKECQEALWQFFVEIGMRRYQNNLENAKKFANAYCSDPTSIKKVVFPHSSGGSIEVTLCERGTRRPLFMGGIFDDPSPISHTHYYEHVTCTNPKYDESQLTSFSIEEAQRNRRLLYNAMTAVGFRNLPSLWWHYDWGTRLWCTLGKMLGTAGPNEKARYS